MKVLIAQSSLTRGRIVCSLPGSSVRGILQARILEWVVAIPFLGDVANPGMEPGSPALQADSLPSEPYHLSYQGLWLLPVTFKHGQKSSF